MSGATVAMVQPALVSPRVHWSRVPRPGGINSGEASEMTGRGRARVGCSGWQYQAWRGVVYPPQDPQRSWLRHHATMFDTVEVNNTVCRMPAE